MQQMPGSVLHKMGEIVKLLSVGKKSVTYYQQILSEPSQAYFLSSEMIPYLFRARNHSEVGEPNQHY